MTATAIRLAELLAGLSLVTDLGMGNPPDEAMRATLLATGLARAAGLAEADVSAVYYTTMLRYVGCHSYSFEESVVFGDDIVMRADAARVDFANPRQAMPFLLSHAGREQPPLRRARLVATGVAGGKRFGASLASAYCEVGSLVAERLSLQPPVSRSLGQLFERWDGKGHPGRLAGEDVEPAVRFAHVACQAVLFAQAGGTEAAIGALRDRAGGALDPHVVALFERSGPALLDDIEGTDPFRSVLDQEPAPHRIANGLEDVARTFADLADLKSPAFHGHARAVAVLAEAAGSSLGVQGAELGVLRCAALLADLGRAGTPNSIWNRDGALSEAQWERVRLHAYHSERILSRSPAFAAVAPLAGMHHERADGSGYHRQLGRGSIPLAARCIAAADAFQAMREPRPYRAALDDARATETLIAAADGGCLDHDAAEAVVAAAGGTPSRAARSYPAGLTAREVDVLRAASEGLTTRQIARRLEVTPKTADHHIQHIYAKIGVSTRAAAALFAMEHDLIRP